MLFQQQPQRSDIRYIVSHHALGERQGAPRTSHQFIYLLPAYIKGIFQHFWKYSYRILHGTAFKLHLQLF